MGLFSKIKEKLNNKTVFENKKQEEKFSKGLEKTRKEFSDKLNNLNKKYKKVNSEYFEELEEMLIMADIGVNTVINTIVADEIGEIANKLSTYKNLTLGVTDIIPDDVIVKILKNYFNGGILNINNQQFNNKGCSVNGIVTNYELMTFIETISGVVQVTSLTSNGQPFNKLEPVINKVLKLGQVTITQEIV